ncbi:MAG TPA: tripartite tricarboxylate transporter substrate binding protein [Burkholderiaceae bacterium]|nr:tripartite tricarboxylate transporter substrate binding protein [Burkholderiaceae bacterium]
MDRRDFVLAAGASALLAKFGAPSAQELPKKPITLVVGFAPGGAADSAARLIAKKLQENIGTSVVIDNRAGAGGNIAHQLVANGPVDGSMILLGSIGPLAIAPHMMKVGYDPQKDLAPLTGGVNFPNILVVHTGVGVKTFVEYVALAKAKPDLLDFASTGVGSASHLAGELLNQRAGIQTVHVPYKGGGPAMQDLLAGRVASYYSTPSTAQPHIASGKLIPLACTGLARHPVMPDVPTIAESGYPGFNATNWYAFVGPGKLSPALQERWNRELVKVLTAPDVKAELDRHGLTPAPSSREELAAFIDSENRTWGRLVRERNIKAE